MSAHIDNDPKLPSYRRPEHIAVTPDLELVADLLAGTRRMHERSGYYIRQWADEENGVYNIRRKVETVFEGLGRVLSAAVGMLFAKAPSMEWNQSEAAFTETWANVDAMGTKGEVFVKRFADIAIRDGLAIILTDHPSAPEGTVVTAANERELGLRPSWAMYERCQAISWRVGKVNNQITLTQLVLHETSDIETEAYGTGAVHRFRVLKLESGVATWTLWEQTEEKARDAGHFRLIDQGTFRNRDGQEATFLPVAVAYAGRTDAPMHATIPLLGVAWANLSHWQSATNLRFYRELCAFPQPVVTGDLKADPQTGQAGTLRFGPMVGIQVSAEGSFQWAELAGTSLEQLVQGVKEKLEQIGQQGMAFLVSDTRAAETAEAKRLDATAENSTLATAAQGIEDAVNMALEHMAWFMGIEKAGAPVLTISRDYDSTAIGADIIGAYSALVGQGFPKRPVLEALKAGGRLPADVNLDELEAKWDATEAAAKDLAAMEAEADAAQFGRAAA